MGRAGPGPDNCKASFYIDDSEHREQAGMSQIRRSWWGSMFQRSDDTCKIHHLCPFFSAFPWILSMGDCRATKQMMFQQSLLNDF
jgi:hypothetical protein